MDFDFLNEIVGERLTAVTFVLDYHQLQFEGILLTILNPITVVERSLHTKVGEDKFRNRLCEQIAKIASRVDCREGNVLAIAFEDGSLISVSLNDKDRLGQEAVLIQVQGKVGIFDVIYNTG